MGDRSGVALGAVALALAVWPSPAGAVRRRVRRFSGPAVRRRAGPRRRGAALPPSSRRWLFAAVAGTAVTVVLGGMWGPVLGAVAVPVVERVLRRGDRSRDAEDEQLALALPLACDLLAVCLEAGVPPGASVAAVAGTAADPLAVPLSRVAGLYRLGADPSRAWTGVPTAMDPMARAFVRAGGSGTAVVPALRALAADVRASSGARTEAAVRRAGVWVLAPLGACFLPAFLCLGVVPLVLGIARDVFG